MNTHFFHSLFLSLLIVSFGCQPDHLTDEPTAEASQADRSRLRYLKEVEWPKAYREHDTVLLDRILAEEFQLIDANGTWSNKGFEMQWIKKNATQYDSFHYEIKRLEILENGTAIVAGSGHIYRDTLYTVYQSSNVLVKRQEEWKAVLSHVSGVKAGG